VALAKLSISIPDELKLQLDERADAENVPVSHVVTEALRAFFGLPADQVPGPPLQLAEQLRQVQAYLWELHFSHECTRSTALNLYYWAQRNGENMGMPPENEMPKPPWQKPSS
jgi:hypothetical protein